MEYTKNTIANVGAKKEYIYNCKICDYITSKKFNLDKHFLTSKHKKLLEVAKNVGNVGNVGKIEDIEKVYKCNCGKEYKHAPSLWNHKKLCTYKEPEKQEEQTLVIYKENGKEDISLNNSLIVQILQENKEIMNQIMTLVSTSLSSVTNNTMINNIQNKQFNLNVYLNETCKDAMNIEDFIKTMVITYKDLDDIGYEGFVVVISRVIVRELGKVEEHLRPFHCTDKKRETFYIKTNGEWKKDADDKTIIITFVKNVANICFRLLNGWKTEKANVKWNDSTNKKHDQYNDIITHIMDCTIPEEKDLLGIEKVIKGIICVSLITKWKNT